MVFDRAAVAVEDGMTELVRGSETRLLDRLAPMVRRRSLALDLGRVERIDAAGITALIQLYRVACEAGNRFRVTNPSPHVGEILALVGLDRILLTPDTEDDEPCCAELAQSAA
ncbi:MAG TPA: STAS domain-containing protein [Terracidiphilus sp.]|nr:STAS domain-containing protein [Terracidiphilus sp.]